MRNKGMTWRLSSSVTHIVVIVITVLVLTVLLFGIGFFVQTENTRLLENVTTKNTVPVLPKAELDRLVQHIAMPQPSVPPPAASPVGAPTKPLASPVAPVF